MKKLAFILFFAVSIISCSNDDGLNTTPTAVKTNSSSRLAATENVKLLKVFTSSTSSYRGWTNYTKRFKVEVKNLAYTKKVVISHKMSDGSWKDFPLSYINSTADNTEIWGADVAILKMWDPILLFGDEFVARCEVNGAKYWDNNGGQNYKIGDNEGTFLRTDLNVSVDTFSSGISPYDGSFSVAVDVRNINPTKLVSVVYSTDNWITTKRADLFISALANRFGMEKWSINLPLVTPTTIKYAVVHKVNGIEYWDNNYGKNYTATK